jgi:hypothetical protein
MIPEEVLYLQAERITRRIYNINNE